MINEFSSKKSILTQYVPKLLCDENEIRHIITDILKDVTIVDKGQVMKFVMPQLKGKVDMKVANKVISDMLKGSSE